MTMNFDRKEMIYWLEGWRGKTFVTRDFAFAFVNANSLVAYGIFFLVCCSMPGIPSSTTYILDISRGFVGLINR